MPAMLTSRSLDQSTFQARWLMRLKTAHCKGQTSARTGRAGSALAVEIADDRCRKSGALLDAGA